MRVARDDVPRVQPRPVPLAEEFVRRLAPLGQEQPVVLAVQERDRDVQPPGVRQVAVVAGGVHDVPGVEDAP